MSSFRADNSEMKVNEVNQSFGGQGYNQSNRENISNEMTNSSFQNRNNIPQNIPRTIMPPRRNNVNTQQQMVKPIQGPVLYRILPTDTRLQTLSIREGDSCFNGDTCTELGDVELKFTARLGYCIVYPVKGSFFMKKRGKKNKVMLKAPMGYEIADADILYINEKEYFFAQVADLDGYIAMRKLNEEKLKPNQYSKKMQQEKRHKNTKQKRVRGQSDIVKRKARHPRSYDRNDTLNIPSKICDFQPVRKIIVIPQVKIECPWPDCKGPINLNLELGEGPSPNTYLPPIIENSQDYKSDKSDNYHGDDDENIDPNTLINRNPNANRERERDSYKSRERSGDRKKSRSRSRSRERKSNIRH